MGMADSPPLLPGCMVMWFDDRDVCNYALVIQYEEHLDNKCYVCTILRDLRIKTLTLFHADNNKRWRVVHAR
jgi:hypothetical protein